MNIRPVTIHDVDAIVRIEKEAFFQPWSKEAFIHEIVDHPFASLLLMEVEGKITGYIGFWLIGDQTQITTLAIKKEFQGRHYGRMLLQRCIALTKERGYKRMSLEVNVTNAKAIAIYESLGFVTQALRKGYYLESDGYQDGYLMVKEMEEEGCL